MYKQRKIEHRVVDPHWFNEDPDPAFFLIADPNPGFWWSKIEKITAVKLFISFGSKIVIYFSLGLQKRRPATGEAFSPQKRTSSIFSLLDLDPDPATQINADPDPQPCSNIAV